MSMKASIFIPPRSEGATPLREQSRFLMQPVRRRRSTFLTLLTQCAAIQVELVAHINAEPHVKVSLGCNACLLPEGLVLVVTCPFPRFLDFATLPGRLSCTMSLDSCPVPSACILPCASIYSSPARVSTCSLKVSCQKSTRAGALTVGNVNLRQPLINVRNYTHFREVHPTTSRRSI